MTATPLAVRQHRSVHLADRGRRDRLGSNSRNSALDRQPELPRDDQLDLLERERRDVVLEAAQLGDDVRRDDVGPRREQLPELDERRPELVEHLAQVLPALRGGFPRGTLLRPPREEVGQPVRLEEVAEAVLDRDLRDLGDPPEVRGSPMRSGALKPIGAPAGSARCSSWASAELELVELPRA